MLPRIIFGLFTLTLLGFSTITSAAECVNNGKIVPGYVQADCSEQEARASKSGCKLFESSEIQISTGGEPAETVDVASTNTPKACENLVDALDACKQQCVPGVTNGGILAGPKNGATAKNYVLGNFLPNLTNGFLIFNIVLGVVFFTIAGFMWVFSAGNEEMTKKALNTVIWTVIGITVSVISYFIVQIVININFFPA